MIALLDAAMVLFNGIGHTGDLNVNHLHAQNFGNSARVRFMAIADHPLWSLSCHLLGLFKERFGRPPCLASGSAVSR